MHAWRARCSRLVKCSSWRGSSWTGATARWSRTARNGSAAAIVQQTMQRRSGRRGRTHAAIGNVARPPSTSHPFRIGDGGSLNAPAGYRVAGMGFAAESAGGALLAMPTADARGVAVALRAPRQAHNRAFVLPVVNPSQPERRGLYPFFFQDRFRSYFVRPIYADWRPPRAVAVPVFASARFGRAPVRAIGKRSAPPARARRGGRGRREEIDEIIDLDFEALDAWEDEQDEAWHPDDAAEALVPAEAKAEASSQATARSDPHDVGRGSADRLYVGVRRRRARPAPRQFVMKRQAGYHEQRLQFVPFEHPDTCRFLSTLKAEGIDGLLAFNTTRPARGGRDHVLQPDGRWARRPGPSWFQRRYGIGPLVFTRSLPHLDVAFEPENPYAAYNWELFFHAPLQVAVRLAKDGRHEEAQRWFHFIFDPTTDSSAPSPKRYWRFAPFYENNEYDNARAMMQVLSSARPGCSICPRRNGRSSPRSSSRSATSCRRGGRSRSRRTSSPVSVPPPIRRRW